MPLSLHFCTFTLLGHRKSNHSKWRYWRRSFRRSDKPPRTWHWSWQTWKWPCLKPRLMPWRRRYIRALLNSKKTNPILYLIFDETKLFVFSFTQDQLQQQLHKVEDQLQQKHEAWVQTQLKKVHLSLYIFCTFIGHRKSNHSKWRYWRGIFRRSDKPPRVLHWS